jgi:hypothetical protein
MFGSTWKTIGTSTSRYGFISDGGLNASAILSNPSLPAILPKNNFTLLRKEARRSLIFWIMSEKSRRFIRLCIQKDVHDSC